MQYHIDPNRIAAAGGSLGGYLVLMLGTTAGNPKFDGEEGDTKLSTRVSAVAALFALSDLVSSGKSIPRLAKVQEWFSREFRCCSFQQCCSYMIKHLHGAVFWGICEAAATAIPSSSSARPRALQESP